jgi:sugar transferase (PEP-CTERM/EpsH1 system associated)
MVAHVIHRLAIGGMENGLVNLINRMAVDRIQHCIICYTEATEFSNRIERSDVRIYNLGKREGKDLRVWGRLWNLLRRLRPHIVHTRNLATLEAQLPAALAGVRVRIHGEHGWDVGDLDGRKARTRWLRRGFRPLVSKYVAVSAHIDAYLQDVIGVEPTRIDRIYNGVDTQRFAPGAKGLRAVLPPGFAGAQELVFGTVGRLQRVKDQRTLLDAFARLRARAPSLPMRLVIIGDGPLRSELQGAIHALRLDEHVWLGGARDDVAELLRAIDVFVLPSLAEGISNTILEAMASGLPVIASNVGGNPELVVQGETGNLVAPASAEELTVAMADYAKDRQMAAAHGAAGRLRAEAQFSLERMVDRYLALYESSLGIAIDGLGHEPRLDRREKECAD